MHSTSTNDLEGKQINPFIIGAIDLIAGSLGGASAVYVSQPLDTVKVKMQTFPETYKKGMFDCFIKTFQQDGLSRGLYAGSVPAVIANVAENSVLFAAYGFCQRFVGFLIDETDVKKLSPAANGAAGFFAAFFSSFTLCPTELVKCRLQALRELNRSRGETFHNITPFNMTRDILRAGGIPGLFRGLTSTMTREMPGYFFFFGGYEVTRNLLTKPGQSKDDIGPLRTMVAGAVGGTALWTAIFPADVIKSRIQVTGSKRGMIDVGLEIFRKEGPMALYNGLMPSVLRTIPATATLFLVYESTKKLLTDLASN